MLCHGKGRTRSRFLIGPTAPPTETGDPGGCPVSNRAAEELSAARAKGGWALAGLGRAFLEPAYGRDLKQWRGQLADDSMEA